MLPPQLRAARPLLIAAALLFAGALAAPQAAAQYYKQQGRAELHNQNYTAAAQAYAQSLLFIPASQHRSAADSWNNLGISLYQSRRFAEAARAYESAAKQLGQIPASRERERYNAALQFNHALAGRQAGDPRWIEELQSACSRAADLCETR
jgi:hypothetical protein